MNRSIKESTIFKGLQDVLQGLLSTTSGKPGLTEGTDAATLKTVTVIQVSINGVPNAAYAATDNIAMTACELQQKSTACKYLVGINAAGTVVTTKGNDATTEAKALLPRLPGTQAPIGFFQIITDSATTFTSGTTDLGAAGLTETYGDLNSVTIIG